ncbi:MAG: serine/threonine protein kinase [Polyangiaceae bacterium]|nr:serine/threonine protein kinase [Polyangiaceae bacterium]
MFDVGDVIDDQYRLVRLIGAGGQGSVFEAEDLEIGAPFAIKVLNREFAMDVECVRRLRREARAMGMLTGTAAVQILALNHAKSGQLYLVMELLRGQDLERYINQFEARGMFIPVRMMLEVLSPVVETLEVAHGRGIVHRDIKPANIFVLDSGIRGRVRLVDFGMAKDLSSPAQLTQEGVVVGSPSYIPPEGWHGKPGMITHSADVYALGALVFRMLSGRVPFHGADLVDVIRQVARGPRPSLHAKRPDLPKIMDPWVARALAIHPQERFGSVRELWDELIAILRPDDII